MVTRTRKDTLVQQHSSRTFGRGALTRVGTGLRPVQAEQAPRRLKLQPGRCDPSPGPRPEAAKDLRTLKRHQPASES